MWVQVGREDEFSINRQQMMARIRVCMGGTVAEELVFGQDQVSSGATDDLRQVSWRLGSREVSWSFENGSWRLDWAARQIL